MPNPWEAQREVLGAFIRDQRKKANLSLRQLAELTSLSNPYLSQVERGLHQPSVRVLKAISDALNLSAESLMAQAGLIDANAAGRQGSADRGCHPRGPTPRRRSEGGADRGLPQHAQLMVPQVP
jgi:transcriptional regulator with XRE-family HTH domain